MARTTALIAVACLCALATAELAFRALPVSSATMTGYYRDPDILTYPPYHRWTVSSGWDLRNVQHLQSNNWGFVDSADFVHDPSAIALIGDSYVEAGMLASGDRPGPRLQSLIGDGRRVYAMGTPGTALLDHAQRIRLASRQFGVRTFVLLIEAADARQALCGSGNVVSRCLDPTSLTPRIERLQSASAIKRVARHSALAQYLFSQLKLNAGQIRAAAFSRVVPAEPGSAHQRSGTAAESSAPPRLTERSRAVVDAVLREFFAQLASIPPSRLIVVVDGQRGSRSLPDELLAERDYLMEQMRVRGAEVVDPAVRYREHYAHSRRILEVSPYDGHLNALGVELVMSEVAERLRGADESR